MTIPAIHPWKDNSELIAACAELGYLRKEWKTLDPTYGLGIFWKAWKPARLVRTDLDPSKSPSKKKGVDFTKMPWKDCSFDAVVFDPPYKLNGRPDKAVDGRYGTAERTRWQDRMALILEGLVECERVLTPGGYLLVKCQDQVVSGHVVWQTDEVTGWATKLGLIKVDRLDMIGTSRPQPMDGRRQKHAHGRASTMLVFKKS
jgi:hypothetical protein